MLPDKGLCGARWQPERPGHDVGRALVEVVVGQAGCVHACVGHQDAFQAIEHEQKWLAVEDGEQLLLTLRRRELLDVLPVLPAHVGQGTDHEVLEAGVALVEAPPQAARQRSHLVWGDVMKPLPAEGAFAHATNGDNVEDAGIVDSRAGFGHPVGQQVQLCLPSDQGVGLQERIGMGDVGFGRRGDVADVVKGSEVGLAIVRQAVDDLGLQLSRRCEGVHDALGFQPGFERLKFDCALAFFDICRLEQMVFVHQEEQPGNASFDSAVVLHFRNRNAVAFGHIAVAVGKDAEVEVGFIDHAQRFRDGLGVAGGQVFHHEWEHALAQAGIAYLVAMLG